MEEMNNRIEIEEENETSGAVDEETAETVQTEDTEPDDTAGATGADQPANEKNSTPEPEAKGSGSEAEAGQSADAAEEPEKTGESHAETEAGSDGQEEKAESTEKSGKPDKKDQQIAELNDRYLRLFAEFDNFRKRSETEKSGMFTEGERTVLLKILPLVDNFERALDTVPAGHEDAPFINGIEKVYRAFADQLKELGVTPIEAVGKEFDANLHNAVMHVEDDEAGENIVVEEFQKGYMFKEKVLRYSMVKVAN